MPLRSSIPVGVPMPIVPMVPPVPMPPMVVVAIVIRAIIRVRRAYVDGHGFGFVRRESNQTKRSQSCQKESFHMCFLRVRRSWPTFDFTPMFSFRSYPDARMRERALKAAPAPFGVPRSAFRVRRSAFQAGIKSSRAAARCMCRTRSINRPRRVA
jgi:hypothetical protein